MLYSKVTATASGPAVVAVRPTVPERFAPGFVNVTVGAVESTVTVTTVVVFALPAASVMIARRSVLPVAPAACAFQEVVYGALATVAIRLQVEPDVALYSKRTLATPEAASAAFVAEMVACVPPMIAPALGTVSEPVGSTLSTRTV